MSNMNQINANLRTSLFNDLDLTSRGWEMINARTYGKIVEDEDGNERYVKIAITIAPLNDEISASRKMRSEIEDYQFTQQRKADKAAAQAKKKALEAALKAELEKATTTPTEAA